MITTFNKLSDSIVALFEIQLVNYKEKNLKEKKVKFTLENIYKQGSSGAGTAFRHFFFLNLGNISFYIFSVLALLLVNIGIL